MQGLPRGNKSGREGGWFTDQQLPGRDCGIPCCQHQRIEEHSFVSHKKKKKSVRKKKEDSKSFLLLLKNRVVSFSLVANAIFRCVWKRQKHSCFVNSGILTHTVCNLANINNRLNYLCLQYFLEPQGVLPVRCYWGPLKAKPVHRCSAPCACYWLSAVLFTSSPCNWHFSLPNWPVQSACHISGTEMPEYPEVPCSGFSFFFFFPIFIPLVDTTLF